MDRPPPSAIPLAAAAAILGAILVFPGLQWPLGFDGAYAYLPMASRLLHEGAAYLHRPDSLATGIVAYAWPAMLGADEAAVRIANIFLYAAVIALAFASVRAAHSARAGVLAAFLVATSPVIHPYIPDVMTEPPFLFFIAVWIASVAAAMRGHAIAAALAGSVALALATFTRPETTFFPVLAGAAFAWRAWRMPPGHREIDAGIALMHGIAAVLIGAFILRNALEFGLSSVATGGGNALYHGVNALVDGFDPTYYGLTYDEGAATHGASHLTIESDRLLRGIALEELSATPFPLVLEMAARKAVAFVFVAAQDWDAAWLRAWRVSLVVFALAAFAFRQRSALVISLTLFAAYLIAVHAPVFYLLRYSAVLDLPLALLAAIGIVDACEAPTRLASLCVAGVLAVAMALAPLAGAGPGSPHPERSPYEEAWVHGAFTIRGSPPDAAVEIPVTGAARLNRHAQSMITMRVAVRPERRGACTALRFRYKGFADREYDPRRSVRVPVRADGVAREMTLGAYAPLALNHEGILRIELECDSSGVAEIGTMRILEPIRAAVYRRRYLDRPGKD